MLELSVSGHLEVAHFMSDFPEGHPNRRMHGHSYFIILTLATLDDCDVVEDFDSLKSKMDSILKTYDHTCVNDWDIPTQKPTMENMCRFFWKIFSKEFPHLSKVELQRPTLGMRVSYIGKTEKRGSTS